MPCPLTIDSFPDIDMKMKRYGVNARKTAIILLLPYVLVCTYLKLYCKMYEKMADELNFGQTNKQTWLPREIIVFDWPFYKKNTSV